MTSIRKLALALCLAGSFSYSNAQVDSTGNLITSGQEHTWTGAATGSYGMACPPNGGACSGGPGAMYDPSTDTIYYSYGQSTVTQTFAINQALSAAGTGIQIQGYNYSWEIQNNNNYRTDQAGIDRLIASVITYNSDGTVRQTDSWTYDTKFDWTTFSGTVNYNNPASISQLGNLSVSFSGADSGFWGGYFGPQVRNVGISLLYNSDPCAADPLSSPTCPGYAEAYKNLMCTNNPLYDPTCPGHDAIITSGNLVPSPSGSSGWLGGSINNSFAINSALSHGGAGVMIHGFNWGYRALNFNPFGGDMGNSTVSVNIRDGDGTSLHAWSRTNTSYGENWYSSSYVFPQSRNNTTLGNFDFTATTSGWGYVDSMWARAVFTPDSCSLDPLSSVLCTKYEEAFLAQQCSITALFSPQCPGYIDAMNAMLAESMPTGLEDTTQVAMVPASTVSSTGTPAQDDTRDPAEVTTDVGGVELSTTGEIKVADNVPAAAKESAKQSDDKKEEKKLSLDQLRAFADRAVRETDQTALAAADSAVEQSQSEAANPSDGTGVAIDLGGLSLRSLQAMAMAGQLQAAPDTLPNRNTEDDRQRSVLITTAADQLQTTIDQTVNTRIEINEITDEAVSINQSRSDDAHDLAAVAATPNLPPETVTPSGPTVRRGGKVEGMEGGTDINSLAATPADFNDYLSQQMQDAQFYASRDIYRGQRNVDNARALRGLGTDRLHQEMINQQYNQGAR